MRHASWDRDAVRGKIVNSSKLEGEWVTCGGNRRPHRYDPSVCVGDVEIVGEPADSNHDDAQDAAAGER